jgi:opacity protein-like surface antigen
MGHYGFMADSEVPGGRINPYIGVGPAILWSGFENPVGFGGTNSANAMNVALIVEPGIRWMALPNVSIDTSMRYRYAPNYDIGKHHFNGPRLYQLAFLVRANYHFSLKL